MDDDMADIEEKLSERIDDIVYLILENIYDAIKRNDKHDIDYWFNKLNNSGYNE